MGRTKQGYVAIQIRLPVGILRMIKIAAAQQSVTVSEYILTRVGAEANPIHIKGDFEIAPRPTATTPPPDDGTKG